MTVINQPTCKLFTDATRFTQLSGYYEVERRTVWMMLRAQPRPCFNHKLIEEIMNLRYLVQQEGFVVDFWVTGSLVQGMYNTGCLLYTSPSPRDRTRSRMPSSA